MDQTWGRSWSPGRKNRRVESPWWAAVLIPRTPGEQQAGRTVKGRGTCLPALRSQFRLRLSHHLQPGGRDRDREGPKWACLIYKHKIM